MLKVLLCFATIGLIASTASAEAIMPHDEQQMVFDKAYCGVIAENYTRGKLADKGIKVHSTRADVHGFMASPGQLPNIYMVSVETMIYQDIALIEKGPNVGYSCYRCPNLELVVSQETSDIACKGKSL